MWLIGMKLRVTAAKAPIVALRHQLATILSGYMAPLGAPVLPDVYTSSATGLSCLLTPARAAWRRAR